jgi:spermidine synthase
LNLGGIAVSWSPTDRVRNTFVKVFPHVLSYGPIVLGSNQPIDFVPERVRSRLMDPMVLDYYAQAGVDIRTLLAEYIDRAPVVFDPAHDRSLLRDINTDLFPKDELGVR